MFKKRKKDTRTYKNFKYLSIDKLKEIIDEPYNRGIDGHDYQPYIEDIIYAYNQKINSIDFDKIIEARYEY